MHGEATISGGFERRGSGGGVRKECHEDSEKW